MSETSVEEATSVSVTRGQVVSLGDPQAAGGAAPHVTLDFGSRVIMPGFIDGHTHVEVGAVAAKGVDCRVPTVTSVADILDQLRDGLDKAEMRGGWLVGQANLFLDQKLRDKRLPTIQELDSLGREVAIVIQAGGHVSCVNSRALELSGLDRKVLPTNMGGPVIERDAHGAPTGRLGELDAALPIPPLSESDLRDALEDCFGELFARYGVTHVCEITESRRGVSLIDELVSAGDIAPRVSLALWVPGTYTLEEALSWQETLRLRSQPDRLRVQGVKVFLDGGFSARTAAMTTTYLDDDGVDTGDRGSLTKTPREIGELVALILDSGVDAIVHTCGEYATQVLAEQVPGGPRRGLLRAEHAGHLFAERAKTFELMESSKILAMTNPPFLHAIGPALPAYVGKAALGNRFLFKDMIDAGFRITGNSDMHVGSHPLQTNPFFMMQCSVGRLGFDGSDVDPDQAVDIVTAMRMHTIFAAEALGLGDRRGSLDVGKDADVIVLDRDPRRVSAAELTEVKVDYVLVGGELVYERPGAQRPNALPTAGPIR